MSEGEGRKVCGKCGEVKSLTDFHSQPSAKSGRHSYCASCFNAEQREKRRGVPRNKEARRRHLLKRRYGLSEEDYNAIMQSQGGKCAICDCVPERPCVDHDHQTGSVRGILCHPCNIKLPAVEYDSYRIPALAYLRRHAANDNATIERKAA